MQTLNPFFSFLFLKMICKKKKLSLVAGTDVNFGLSVTSERFLYYRTVSDHVLNALKKYYCMLICIILELIYMKLFH